MAKSETKPVSFRLEGPERRKLEREAEKRGYSAGAYAREVVLAALESGKAGPTASTGGDTAAIAASLNDIRKLLETLAHGANSPGPKYGGATEFRRLFQLLRGDIATATAAVLARGGKVDPEDAMAWVKVNLFSRESSP